MTSSSSAVRSHLAVSLLFVLSRAAFDAIGIQFYFMLDWMWLSDPADLRDRLAETLWFFHAFPPGINALTGVLLKVGGDSAASLGHTVFWGLGLIMVNALCYLGRAIDLSRQLAVVIALAFALTPASIYFEHLYHYDYPVATLLAVSAVLFHRAVREPSSSVWLAFFAVCALIGLTRSTFHLIWFAGMLLLVLAFTPPGGRRLVLRTAMIPAALLLALYAKNYALFGDFAASSFGPANYTLVTAANLPDDVREAWIREGELSPYANVSVYAPPREYARFFETPEHAEWPPQLTRLRHTAVNAPNFNHWWLLEVHRARRGDVIAYVRERPLDYLENVGRGVVEMFKPTTAWHPRDGTPASPHHQHRQVLGTYEAWFNRVLHGIPPPVGLYVLLPVPLVWALVHGWRLGRHGDPHTRARGALLLFAALQILYVVAVSTMLTAMEWPRYRYQVEAFIWVLAAAAIAGSARQVRQARQVRIRTADPGLS